MSKIAFLGTGAMGSRMAQRLADEGHDLVVWNRSESATRPFAEREIRVARSPREAAVGAEIVLSMVRDDQASRSVWLDGEYGALAAMGPNAVGIECSTVSLAHIGKLAGAFAERDRRFLDAPLAGSRPQAEAGQLIFFVGGSAETLERVRPNLEALAGAIHHVGDAGAGAAVKLIVNGLFGVQLAVMGELIGFADKAKLDLYRTMEVIKSTPVCSPAVAAAAEAMLKGAFAPAFPVELVAKDFTLVESSAAAMGAGVPLCQNAGDIYRRGVAEGFGGDNITGIVQLYRG